MRSSARLSWAFLIALACCDAPVPAARVVDEPRPWGDLAVAERGAGDRAIVLLHGYGAPGDDLVGFADELAREVPNVLVVVPSAPRTSGPGRAWFEPPISLQNGPRDRHAAQRQIDDARERLEGVIDTLRRRGIPRERVVVAGFSQGAMMSLDVALRGEARVAGVGFLSGGPLPGWPLERARGLRVFSSHGTGDSILAFADADALRTDLTRAGADVERIDFEGGHGIPREVRARFATWLRATLPR